MKTVSFINKIKLKLLLLQYPDAQASGQEQLGNFPTLPDGIFLQQQFDKLPGNMQREHALRHLLQDPQVVAVSGGEPICSRHDAPKH